MTSKPHLELSIASGFEGEAFKEIAEDLRAGGAQVAVNRRPPEGPYVFLEWLIPTAVILWMFKPYLEEFSKETGKLHANGRRSRNSRGGCRSLIVGIIGSVLSAASSTAFLASLTPLKVVGRRYSWGFTT